MRHPLNRFRVWLADNDPFLRVTQVGVYVLIGGAFAVYIGWQQTRIADQQTQLAEHQLAVSREQLKVAAAQAEIARATLVPRFEFIPSNLIPPTIGIRSSRSDIHDLTCRGALFIEREQPTGKKKRVRIGDFFTTTLRVDDGLTWRLYTDELKNRAALLDFQYPPEGPKKSLTDLLSALNYSYCDGKTYTVHCYFEMRYFNAAKESIIDRYVAFYPAWRPRPVTSEPDYAGTIKFSDFLKDEGGYDYTSLYASIDKFIGPAPTRAAVAASP
ncbi:MAG TPA: hypothetical protein VMP01_00905 [Pirellulaceae bacterium]|nr:hypothetical protein [Pirellulaceae bacterium]